MQLQFFLIVLGSLTSTVLITRIGLARRWGKAFSHRLGPSLLIFLAMGSLFIGSTESSSAAGLSADTNRTTRAIVLCFIFAVCAWGILINPIRIKLAGSASGWMALYSVLAMLSSSYSISPFVSLWKGFEVFVFVILGIYLSRYFSTREDIQWGLDIICLSMLYFSISVIFSIGLMPALALPKSLGMSGNEIVSGAHSVIPAIYPNSVTQFAALLFCLALCQFLSNYPRRGKTILLCILGLGGLVMVLGHSRTSILAAGLACGIILLVGRYFFTAVVIGLVAFAGLLYGIGDVLTSYMLRGQTQQAFYGMTGRTYYWKSIWNVVLDSPLFGHGFYAQRVILSVSSVDNTYLQILLGLGAIGLIVILFALLTVTYKLVKTRPHGGSSAQEKSIWLQLVSLFIIIMVRSMTGPTFQDFNINLVLLLLTILAVTTFDRISHSEEARETPDTPVHNLVSFHETPGVRPG